MFFDDVGYVNPLSPVAKSNKMAMSYWTIANIYPEYRSNKNCTQLHCIVETDYFKKKGALRKIMEPFMPDIKILETAGLNIVVNYQTENFKGSVLFSAGDTPASALLGGYKESVSAFRPCRTCLTDNVEWKIYFHENHFHLRNKVEHDEHVRIVSDPTPSKVAIEFWKTYYGVNKTSCLMNIMDVTKCLPQDAMHIILEGPLPIVMKHLSRHCIIDLHLFSIDDLNNNLKRFEFGHFKKDKPAMILSKHLDDNNSLRQSAAQMFTLANTFLFSISEWTFDCEKLDEHIDCFVTLIQLMNVTLAYEIHE